MSKSKLYIGTKIIIGEPMNRQEYNDYRGWKVPADEDPTDEGFLVEYEETDPPTPNMSDRKGYCAWSPKDVFEEAYRPMIGLTFGMALEALKSGKRVARKGWNGKGMFVYLVPANTYKTQTDVAKKEFGESVEYGAYMALKTVSGVVNTWVPSVSDALAEDWEIV